MCIPDRAAWTAPHLKAWRLQGKLLQRLWPAYSLCRRHEMSAGSVLDRWQLPHLLLALQEQEDDASLVPVLSPAGEVPVTWLCLCLASWFMA